MPVLAVCMGLCSLTTRRAVVMRHAFIGASAEPYFCALSGQDYARDTCAGSLRSMPQLVAVKRQGWHVCYEFLRPLP